MNECLILFQPSEFKFSLKFDDQLLTSHNPAYENTLKVLMKESAEFCDIDALVQVIEQPWQSKGQCRYIVRNPNYRNVKWKVFHPIKFLKDHTVFFSHLKGDFILSSSDLLCRKTFTTTWRWIEVCQNVVGSKTDITMNTINNIISILLKTTYW